MITYYNLPRSPQHRLDLLSTRYRFGVTLHRATLQSHLRQAWQIRLVHAYIAQVLWKVHSTNQIVDSLHSFPSDGLITFVTARSSASNSHCLSSLGQLWSSCVQVEAHSMR